MVLALRAGCWVMLLLLDAVTTIGGTFEGGTVGGGKTIEGKPNP